MILIHYFLWGEVGVGDVSLESVPACVLGYLLLADLYSHVLAYFKELVVSAAVDLGLGQGAAAVGLAQAIDASLAVVGVLVCPFL